jgi:hypothetical protein
MTCRSVCRGLMSLIACEFRAANRFAALFFAVALALCAAQPLSAQQPREDSPPRPAQQPNEPANKESSSRQAELETAFVKMLSGATLEGRYTSTGRGRDPTKLRSEKYTIGEVKKVGPGVWMISARIQYGEHDVTLPIAVPIRWADDTPVIVVDNQALPGFGTVSARVMFFADHYAGYWKHGDHGGHLFGTISRESEAVADEIAPNEKRSQLQPTDDPSRGDAAGDEKPQQ